MSNRSENFVRYALALAVATLWCAQASIAAQQAPLPATAVSQPVSAAPSSSSKQEKAKDVRVDSQAVVANEEHAVATAFTTPTLASEKAGFANALFDVALAQLHDQKGDQNAVVSSFSLANALGLVHLGAKGKTAREMAGLFQHGNGVGAALLPRRISEINLALDKPAAGNALTVANRLWVSQSLAKTLVPTYAKQAQRVYQSDAQLVSFDAPAVAASQINEWINRETRGNIPALIQAQQLGPNVQLVATNAVYFKGQWTTPFDPAATTQASFTLGPGKTVAVPTMRSSIKAGLASRNGAQMVELPYKGDDLVMQIAIPAPDKTLAALEHDLSGAKWLDWAASMGHEMLDVSLPRFKLGGKVVDLKSTLQALGVETVFGQGADLSGLSPGKDLSLDNVYQSATVQVDEAGAEAAAATAAVVRSKSLSFPTSVLLNRPFLFAIVHKPTQTPLFMGRVMNPAQQP